MKKSGVYFLLSTMILYLVMGLFRPEMAYASFNYFLNLIVRISAVFTIVIALMVVSDLALNPKNISKHMGKGSGAKGWLISILAGIISTGPSYFWYPLLSDLKKSGMRTALVATFLYNRAVKLSLLPFLIYYFGLAFTIILTAYMIIFSIISGILIEKIVD